jgi:outer membrane protein assembly factor BamD (BamD/ComL family)
MPHARFAAAALLILTPALVSAQKNKRNQNNDDNGYDPAARATVLHVANLYVMVDSNDPPIATVMPGHEIIVMNRNGAWVNAFVNTDEQENQDPDQEPEFKDPNQTTHQFSGWMHDQGIVGPKTPHGDEILYGAAAEYEAQAAEPHPPKDAAQEAHLLYKRVVDYFPDSPLAAESMFRSADIRWQLEKLDNSTLPSAHEQQAYLRPQIYDGDLKKVMKLYPGTPQAARAAFDLIDNKLCGDWQGLPKCPEMETQLYVNYADRYPNGPKSAEALYDAAYRQGVLVTMYGVDDDKKNAAKAAQNCQAIADELEQKYPKSDYAARAESIAFRVKQGIPIYGSDRD